MWEIILVVPGASEWRKLRGARWKRMEAHGRGSRIQALGSLKDLHFATIFNTKIQGNLVEHQNKVGHHHLLLAMIQHPDPCFGLHP